MILTKQKISNRMEAQNMWFLCTYGVQSVTSKWKKLDVKSSWHFPALQKMAHTLPLHIDKAEL